MSPEQAARTGVALALAFVAAVLLSACPVTTPPPTSPTGGTVATGGSAGASGGSATGGTECRYLPTSKARVARNSRIVSRIVGGGPAPAGRYPWIGALETPSGWQYCAGSVIAQRWVLTAAHCRVDPGDVVHLGTVDLASSAGWRVTVSEVRNHWRWAHTTSGHDVAVLRLAADADVTPVELADVTPDDGWAVAIGWGAIESGGPSPPALKHVSVPIVPWSDCYLHYPGQLDRTMVCAGQPGSDSCQGDSGGPLWSSERGLVGVTSWGRGCADSAPGVNTAVARVREWIEACAQ